MTIGSPHHHAPHHHRDSESVSSFPFARSHEHGLGDAANDHFTEQTDTFVDWRSADCAAQATALAWLNTATGLPWTQFLADKAVYIAAWWTSDGSTLYADWAADVCTEYPACTDSVNAAYTTMVTTIADARDAYHADTPEGGDPGGDPAAMLPVKRDLDAATQAADQTATAQAAYSKAAAANLQLALDTDAAGTDQQALPQPNAKFTHEEPPFLPWYVKPGAPGIRQRLERILERRTERFIGDVASFYLPYVEQAIEFDPDIRIICLQRPREEVVAGFSRSVDKASTVPTNYWCKELPPRLVRRSHGANKRDRSNIERDVDAARPTGS